MRDSVQRARARGTWPAGICLQHRPAECMQQNACVSRGSGRQLVLPSSPGYVVLCLSLCPDRLGPSPTAGICERMPRRMHRSCCWRCRTAESLRQAVVAAAAARRGDDVAGGRWKILASRLRCLIHVVHCCKRCKRWIAFCHGDASHLNMATIFADFWGQEHLQEGYRKDTRGRDHICTGTESIGLLWDGDKAHCCRIVRGSGWCRGNGAAPLQVVLQAGMARGRDAGALGRLGRQSKRPGEPAKSRAKLGGSPAR